VPWKLLMRWKKAFK
jgi:glycerate 2-kinase